MQKEAVRRTGKQNATHGRSVGVKVSSEYAIWRAMRQRCRGGVHSRTTTIACGSIFIVDPGRVDVCRAAIGVAPWCGFNGIFGNPYAVQHYMPRHTARILAFPERRIELGKIRDELAELRRTIRGGC